MAYVEPHTVLAPKALVKSIDVLYSTGSGGWSLARVGWEGSQRLGIRWNGSEQGPGIGSPQSRGNATWFILPEALEQVVLEKIEELNLNAPGGLLDQYREMASDSQHEADAQEWAEGLIGDASAEG